MKGERRIIRPGEPLAMASDYIQRGPEAMFWYFGSSPRENEYDGTLGIVYVDGPLEHRDSWGDNYEAIRTRVQEALDTDECRTLVLRISSPGGVVSGLDDSVRAIQKAIKRSGKRSVSAVDQLAASAAYALSCAAGEIVIPRAGIAGSVGVISTMVDVAKRDRKEGINWVTLTSGRRKADGHVHVPITAEALAVEQARVDKFAMQFWQLAAEARGMSVAAIRKLEAGLFVGKDAVRAGLADSVMSWDKLVETLKEVDAASDAGTRRVKDVQRSDKGNTTKRTERAATGESDMSVSLAALVKDTKKKIAAESDPAKKTALAAQLAAYEATKKAVEDDDEEEDEEEEEEEESEESAESDDDEDDDSDDDDDEEEEDEEEEEEASAKVLVKSKAGRAALARVFAAAVALTGQKTARGVLGGLEGTKKRLAAADANNDRIAKLEKNERGARVDNMLREARRAGKVTKKMVASLRKIGMRSVAELKGHLAVLPQIVRPREEGGGFSEPVVDGRPPAYGAKLGMPSDDEQRKVLGAAAAAAGMSVAQFQAASAKAAENGAGSHGNFDQALLNGKPLAS